MTTLAQLVAAPLEIEITNEDGTKSMYRLSVMRDRDFAEFELFLQSKYVDTVKKHTADLPRDERMELMDKALARVPEITVTSNEGVREMNTMCGMIELVYISLRHEHPNITREEVSRLMMRSEVAEQVLEKVSWLNGGETKKKPRAPKEQKHTEGQKPQITLPKRLDKVGVYVDLSLTFGWSPQVIADLTPAQQLAILDEMALRQSGGSTTPTGTVKFRDMRQFQAWQATQNKGINNAGK